MYDIIPQRKEFLAGLQGLGGGPTGYQFRRTIVPEAKYIDDNFMINVRRKNPFDTTLSQYSADRVDAGMKFAQVGDGKSLLMNYPGSETTQCFMKDTAFTGATASKTFTLSFWFYPMNTQSGPRIMTFGRTDVNAARFELTLGHYLSIAAWDSSNYKFLDVHTSSYQPIRRCQWQNITISFDVSDTSKRKAYINDTSFTNWTWERYQNSNILFDSAGIGVGCGRGSGGGIQGIVPNGYLAHFYFDQTYTDIGQESNRRIFRTADGVPTSKASLIARNPLLYMPWDDQDTLETNFGTGGDMYAKSSISSGGSVSYNIVNFGPNKADSAAVAGGLVWTKMRRTPSGPSSAQHVLVDTEMTGENTLTTENTNGYRANSGWSHFDHSGIAFEPGYGERNSGPDNSYVDWLFQRQKGFFDLVKYTGNGTSGRQIEHNLDCVPGLMIVKQVSADGKDWAVYNCRPLNNKTGQEMYMKLNSHLVAANDNGMWNGTAPTKTHFTLGNDYTVNESGKEYRCYLFAHAPSQVEGQGNDGYKGLRTSSAEVPFSNTYSVYGKTSDTSSTGRAHLQFYDMGTDDYTCPGEFTWEMWYKQNASAYCYLFTIGDSGSFGGGNGVEAYFSGTTLKIYRNGSALGGNWTQNDSNWHHFAMIRNSSNTLKVYIDGTERYSFSNITGNIGGDSRNNFGFPITIGGEQYNGTMHGGMRNVYYSNCRLTKGQNLYPGNFTPPTSPLTTTSQGAIESNVKLLALQGSTPLSVTVAAQPPSGAAEYSFGKDANQGVINIGNYKGNSDNEGPVVYIGWQPQYLLIRGIDQETNWQIFDGRRGVALNVDCERLNANSPTGYNNVQSVMFTSTGFQIKTTAAAFNEVNKQYLFMAIRYPDGLVGRPPEEGNEVFGMDTGFANAKINAFSTMQMPKYNQWPVDFTFNRIPSSSSHWDTSARLLQWNTVQLDNTSSMQNITDYNFDWQTGWGWKSNSGWGSSRHAWMWRRHNGFDLSIFRGDVYQTNHHNLGVVPEMIWIKNCTQAQNWFVYHSGCNGGTNPQNYWLRLNNTGAEEADQEAWNNTAPTDKVFSTGNWDGTGGNPSQWYMAMLWASVDKISKVGHYTGTGVGGNTKSINVGFQPRYIMIKCTDTVSGTNYGWLLWDNLRFAGGVKSLSFTDAAQISNTWIQFTSTGFTLDSTGDNVNGNGKNYIYYCHA